MDKKEVETTKGQVDEENPAFQEALKGLKNAEDEEIKVESVGSVSAARCAIFIQAFPDKDLDQGVLITVKSESYGEKVDYLVKVTGAGGPSVKLEVILTECKIMYEDLSPTQLVEYRFEEEGAWLLCPVSLPAVESYRKAKFKLWKDMITKPSCEAAFKRMLKCGLINKMYDDQVFKTPEEDRGDWEVTNESGKKVKIPHPVESLRVWDAEKDAYKNVSAYTEGAPVSPGDVDTVWKEMLVQFKAEHGAEFIDKMMS